MATSNKIMLKGKVERPIRKISPDRDAPVWAMDLKISNYVFVDDQRWEQKDDIIPVYVCSSGQPKIMNYIKIGDYVKCNGRVHFYTQEVPDQMPNMMYEIWLSHVEVMHPY